MRKREIEPLTVCVLVLLAASVIVYCVGWATAAGTATLAQTRGGVVRRMTWDWVSHTDGTVVGTVSGAIYGRIVGVVTDPGTTAPTDNYDVTMIDSDGFDVFNAQGMDRDTANTERFVPGLKFTDGTTQAIAPVYVAGTLELRIANAGSAKVGRVILLMVD